MSGAYGRGYADSRSALLTGLARLRRYLWRPEVRRDPVRILLRRAVYETERRLTPGRLPRERMVRFDDDLRIAVRLSEIYGRWLYLYGECEFYATRVFTSFVSTGAVVVDVGAHLGYYTLLAAKRTGPSGRVVSFEPNPAIWPRLLRNIAANGFEQVTPLNVAVSNFSGTAPFGLPPDLENPAIGSLRIDDSQGVIEVECARLDDVLDKLDISWVDVMKVDAERAEAEVFDGARHTLFVSKPAILFDVYDITADEGYVTSESIEQLRKIGYRMFGMRAGGKGHWNLVELEPGRDPRPFGEPWLPLALVALHPASKPRSASAAYWRFGRRSFD